MAMKLSLGSISYYWSKKTVFDFYKKIANTAVDIVYIGEVICSKRNQLKYQDWFEIADLLKAAGKEVIISSLTLLEAESELKRLKRLCAESDYMIEANDFAAIQILSELGKPFITGVSVNLYNNASLNLLFEKGLKRWCLPVELSKDTLADIQKDKPTQLATEVFVWGRLPLAYSARCYTARAHNLAKDDCQYRCIDYKDGMLLSSREDQPFLMINGIQTQSASIYNLATEIEIMRDMNVDVIRINPQYYHTDKIIHIFSQVLKQQLEPKEADRQLQLFISQKDCNGYWFGDEGMAVNIIKE